MCLHMQIYIYIYIITHAHQTNIYVCVCVRERERERERAVNRWLFVYKRGVYSSEQNQRELNNSLERERWQVTAMATQTLSSRCQL